MLSLQGHDAALMFVAKNGMRSSKGTTLQRLQAVVAVFAGLSKAEQVAPGQVLRMLAELHDKLVSHGLLQSPAQGMLDSFRSAYILGEPSSSRSAKDVFLEAMVSNIACMRMATDDGTRLVVWEDGLPAGFASQAADLLDALLSPQSADCPVAG